MWSRILIKIVQIFTSEIIDNGIYIVFVAFILDFLNGFNLIYALY